jgi:hypothetical protein
LIAKILAMEITEEEKRAAWEEIRKAVKQAGIARGLLAVEVQKTGQVPH